MPWLAAAAPIVGGLASAGGAIGAAELSQPGGTSTPHFGQAPTGPPGTSAFQNILMRTYLQNMGNQPPSFLDWARSGGTETFPFQAADPTPMQAQRLGIVGRSGEAIPFVDPMATSLTPEQRLYLGMQLNRTVKGHGSAAAKGYRVEKQAERLEAHPEGPRREARIERLRSRSQQLLGLGDWER